MPERGLSWGRGPTASLRRGSVPGVWTGCSGLPTVTATGPGQGQSASSSPKTLNTGTQPGGRREATRSSRQLRGWTEAAAGLDGGNCGTQAGGGASWAERAAQSPDQSRSCLLFSREGLGQVAALQLVQVSRTSALLGWATSQEEDQGAKRVELETDGRGPGTPCGGVWRWLKRPRWTRKQQDQKET